MKKRILTVVAAGLMAAILSMPVLAGEWKQEGAGWWYQNDDGSYPSNGWTWVDGKCYYFTPDGYCLMNTQTPDGYTVDASGAWVIDGVVQTQEPAQEEGTSAEAPAGITVQVDGLTFTAPEGFVQDLSETDGVYLYNETQMTAIVLMSGDIPSIEEYQELVSSMQELVLDMTMEETFGAPTNSSTKQLNSGTWYCYEYADAAAIVPGVPGSIHIYARINGIKLQLVMFAGNTSGMDVDGLMNNNLR